MLQIENANMRPRETDQSFTGQRKRRKTTSSLARIFSGYEGTAIAGIVRVRGDKEDGDNHTITIGRCAQARVLFEKKEIGKQI